MSKKNSNQLVVKQSQQIQQVNVQAGSSPVAIMEMALNNKLDLDRVEKMLELQEKWEKNEARKAFHAAMSDFKLNPPEIVKDKHVHFDTTKGPTDYDHATLGNVTEKIVKRLAECNISHCWITNQKENGQIKVTCKLTHSLGHSEENSLESLPDPSGGKNSVQAIASAVTYLQRYTLLSITGLATHDQDDDGAKSEPVEFITIDQVTEINDLIIETKTLVDPFLRWLGNGKINCVEEIPATHYDAAITALEKKRK